MFELISRVGLLAAALGAVLLVPEPPWRHLADPPYQAAVSALLFLGVFGLSWILRAMGRRVERVERILLAVFLASMPTVYITSCARAGQGAWLWVELGGLGLFASLAWLGVWSSPWWLVLGIAGHGLGWDVWHHWQHGYMPRWYADACLITDLGFAFYAAAQVKRWRASSHSRCLTQEPPIQSNSAGQSTGL